MVNTRSSGTNEFDPVKDIIEIIKKLLSDELEKQTSKLVEEMSELKNQIQVLKQNDSIDSDSSADTVVDVEHRGPPLPKNGKHDEWNTTSYKKPKKPKRNEEAHTKQSRTQGQQFKVSQSSLSKKESDKIIRDVNVASSSENVEDSEDELLSETRERLLANNIRSYNSEAGMTWTTQHPPVTRRRAYNIATFLERFQNESETITPIKEAFKLVFSEGMMNEICLNTNLRENAVVAKWNERNPVRQKIWENVTMNELHAFMSILLAAGRNHGRRLHITGMWCEGELFRQPFFTAAMPRDRYKEIFRNIIFDDPTTRSKRIENTKNQLQVIRTLYDQFIQNCIGLYSPGAYITVDESLVTFRGKCPFRVYMKSKPGRYGIKILVCADYKTGFVLNSQVYTGMIDGQREKDQRKRVVLDLVGPYFGAWRGLATDNFFTSVPLAEHLFRNKLTFT
ncbi:hypothetical protein JTB14_005144 [Gonioctena quinquepunctata]|nr:hypothetical protein JTB14_005144 [Gonioctena quinquepunctata]